MEKKILYFLWVIILSMIGCESIIDVKTPYNEPKITVNGFLQPDSSIVLSLTESKFILEEGAFVPVENAKIKLFEGDLEMGEFKSSGNGWYTTKKKPKVGGHYSVRIESSKLGTVEAEAFIPEKVKILDVRFLDQKVQKYHDQYHVMDIFIDDPVEKKNFYEIMLVATISVKEYKNDILIHTSTEHYAVDLAFGDSRMEGENTFGGATSLIFNDNVLKEPATPLRVYAKSRQLVHLKRGNDLYYAEKDKYRTFYNDALHLILRHTDDSYYYFRKSLSLQSSNKGNPFAEPVKVFSNVKNGLGIFAGYNSNKFSVDISKIYGYGN